MINYFTPLLLMITLVTNALSQSFVHPGGLHTQEDLDRMKTKVAEGAHPWIDGWNELIKDPLAQNTYVASPRANMNLRQLMSKDAHAAYLNAIRWYISGDNSYADCAIRILNAYANTLNQIPSGGNTDIVGLGGIGISELAMAGEIMRISSRWESADFNRFKEMMVNYLYPVCHDFLTNHRGACIDNYWANWDSNNITALIAIGVLCDNREIFNEGIEYFKNGLGTGSIKHAVPFIHEGNLGQWQESGRDQSHGFLGVGLLATGCQIAWNQGVDLFGYDDNRLLKGAEYVAKYNLGEDVPFTFYNNCQPANNKWPAINARGVFHDRPVYEMIYNHYVVRKGLSAPNTQIMAGVMRPERGSLDHFGYGTLTFTLEPSTLPANPVPPPPSNVTAIAGTGRVFLKWQPTVGNTARGYQVQRATSAGGPFTTVTTWDGNTFSQYTDTNVSNGTSYYYRIAGINQAGTGQYSEVTHSVTPAAPGELPIGWVRGSIGETTGSSSYAEVNGKTFVVASTGLDVGGNADNVGFTYTTVSGDATITARISSGSSYRKIGLMMRESLEPGAKTVARCLGDAGGRFASMGTRVEKGASMSFSLGNTYTWIPAAWFKIVRQGNTFTTYESPDGESWFTIGSQSIPMNTSIYVGLVAASGSATNTASAIFDNVSLVSATTTSPSVPTNIKATSSSTQILLNWDFVANASGYNVMRSTTSGGPYVKVASGLNVAAFTDSNLENGKTYYYVITAVNFAGESDLSVELAAVPELTIPPAPMGVAALEASPTQIRLTWNASFSAEKYHIKRSDDNGGPYTTIATTTSTEYNDTGLVTLKTYFYVVSAVNSKGESTHSVQTSATPTLGHLSYWKFDESGSTSAADFWGDRDAVLNSGATFTKGLHGNAVNLDGKESYISLPVGIVSPLKDFSISLLTKINASNNWSHIFDFGSDVNRYMFLTASGGSGTLRYAIKNGGGEQQINTTTTLQTGKWHHLVVTQLGTTAILYLDGVEVGRNTTITLYPSHLGNTTQNWIGKSQFPDPLYNGLIDDFRIYSRALGASEIADMAASMLPPVAPKNLSTILENNQILIRWTSSPGEVTYNVKRAANIDGPFNTIANLKDTTYADTNLIDCQDYFYTVSAVNTIGESPDVKPTGPSLGTRLLGLLIGTNGSWNNNPATMKAAAVDGDLNTFFDAAQSNNSWVGYDLGADGKSVITRIRYAPRATHTDRMLGGLFQGANNADFSDAVTLFRITSVPSPGLLTEQIISYTGGYRYVRYLAPTGSANVAEIEFYGLPANLPRLTSDSIVPASFNVPFHYSATASDRTKHFTATGLPEGLSIDTCNGVVSGVPLVKGDFLVALTMRNYFGSTNDTIEVVIKERQTITFGPIPSKYPGDGDVVLMAVSSSGLPVSYTSSDTTVATIVGDSLLRVKSVGSTIINATQSGDSLYFPAQSVSQRFTVDSLNISVLYKDGNNGQSASGSIKPQLQIANNSTLDVGYEELTIRYWLTAENYAGINTWIDYAQMGKERVSAKYVVLDLPYNKAFGYVEYSFDALAGRLSAGGKSGAIQSRLSNTDWSFLDEKNDYSYSLNSSYLANDHITLYRNGVLLSGTEPDLVIPTLKLKVYSENKNSRINSSSIHTYLKLVNEGNVPLDYNHLSVRYWFTKDSQAALNFWIDYAKLGTQNLKSQFVAVSPAVNGADTYFEITVNGGAGKLYPLSQTGNIQYRIAKSNWSLFDESDDHSYLPKAPFAENGNVTVYYRGELVYGTEPSESNGLATAKTTKSQSGDGTVNLYPNPVSVILNLEMPSDLIAGQVKVYSRSGELALEAELSNDKPYLNVSALKPGFYFLKVTSGKAQWSQKFIKMNE